MERQPIFKHKLIAILASLMVLISSARPTAAIERRNPIESTLNRSENHEFIMLFQVTSKSSGLGTLDKKTQTGTFYLTQNYREPEEVTTEEDGEDFVIEESAPKFPGEGKDAYQKKDDGFMLTTFMTETDTEGLRQIKVAFYKTPTRKFFITNGELTIWYKDAHNKLRYNKFAYQIKPDGYTLFNGQMFETVIFTRGCQMPQLIHGNLCVGLPNGQIVSLRHTVVGKDSKGKKATVTWSAKPQIFPFVEEASED